MNWFESWFLKRLLRKRLAQQTLRSVMIVLAKESKDYYTESNRPTVTAHLHELLDDGLQAAWKSPA